MTHLARATIAILLALSAACSSSPGPLSDGATPSSSAPGEATVAPDLNGRWRGDWVNETFGSTGKARLDLVVDGSTVTGVLDFNGSVFGGPDPDPEAFGGSLDGAGAFTFGFESPVYGKVDGSIAADGTITVSGVGVPNERIDRFEIEGQATEGRLEMTYTIHFAEGDPATGRITLTK